MNFLAHALRAGPEPADRLGGMLGDFVKGPLDPAAAGLPRELVAGLILHRRIDSYAEAHAAFRASRARVSRERRRYAGIMVDLFYDHFLARHWARYSGQALEAFAADTYALLETHGALLPPRFARLFAAMRDEDWLAGYRSPAMVRLALDRMAAFRLSRPSPLAGAGAELEVRYGEFEQDFLAFFPDALAFAETVRRLREG
jgi:acyl carrier protein phosphodiesterase